MKINCDVCIVSRLQPHLKNRWIKSTLAIGSHPPNSEKSEYFIVHFTATNKTGTRHRIKNNIEKVFIRCIESGKITLSLKDPQIDLQVKGEAVHLKQLLKCLKLAMEGKKVDENGRSLIAPIAATTKHQPVKTTMTIYSRKDYPLKGFPKTLQTLTITGVKLIRIDPQVFQLSNLTHLTLTDNRIENLPDQLGMLRLQILEVSKNDLSQTSWSWLRGKVLSGTLYHLDLTQTNITKFPMELLDVERLTKLEMANNRIIFLPFSIRAMKSLRHLNVSGNKICTLPDNLNLCQLDYLDVSNNDFGGVIDVTPRNELNFSHPSSLLEIAARVVTRFKFNYTSFYIPDILCDFMNKMPLCSCGNVCFTSPVVRNCGRFWLKHKRTVVVKNMITELRRDSVFCSKKCYDKEFLRIY